MTDSVSTEQMISKLKETGTSVVDIRPAEAYHGWTLQNEARGGHIPGARNLPFKWTGYIDWIEMVRKKGITPGQEVIVYGYEADTANKVADRFRSSGFHHVKTYIHFLSEWVPHKALPLEKLSRFRHLVSAEWVHELVSGAKPPMYENDRYLIVHAHYRNRDAYLGGHIPGAVDMDTLAVEDPETWNRRTPAELKNAFEKHGITSDTTVVLYGKFQHPDNNDPFPGSAAGDIGAIRIALIMMYAGVKDVRILNGGFQSWKDGGYEISYADEPKDAVAGFGAAIPKCPEYFVDTPQAKEMLAAKNAELVCVRSWPEYIGEVSGYHYIEPRGRIPGAVFADCGSDAYHMENYRNFDHTIREYHETADIWGKSGITPDKHLAFYCGTGWRGSEAWFNAWLMGWPAISVYDGGWFEWSADPENPFETGVPEPSHIYPVK